MRQEPQQEHIAHQRHEQRFAHVVVVASKQVVHLAVDLVLPQSSGSPEQEHEVKRDERQQDKRCGLKREERLSDKEPPAERPEDEDIQRHEGDGEHLRVVNQAADGHRNAIQEQSKVDRCGFAGSA